MKEESLNEIKYSLKALKQDRYDMLIKAECLQNEINRLENLLFTIEKIEAPTN